MFSSQSSEHCQSKFFKEWHPDYIASYNSLGDPHLRHYFNHPARKNHLTRNHQVSPYTTRFICIEATLRFHKIILNGRGHVFCVCFDFSRPFFSLRLFHNPAVNNHNPKMRVCCCAIFYSSGTIFSPCR